MLNSKSRLDGVAIFLWIVGATNCHETADAARADGRLTLRVTSEKTGEPIAVRMELRDSRGRSVRVRAEGVVSHGDYFAFDGEVTLPLRKGQYTFFVEAGPEYLTRLGHFTIERRAEDSHEVVLKRHVDMQSEGWWTGDLDVRHRDVDLPLLMEAVGLDLAPSWIEENVRGKCRKGTPLRATPRETSGSAGLRYWLDYRRGGGLALFCQGARVEQTPDVCLLEKDGSSLSLLRDQPTEAVTVIALTPYGWDLPLWIATGKVDAVQVLHRHSGRDKASNNEGWGRPRDKTFFPGKQGNGRYSEAIYHHLLSCGLQIPPSAGSGSGANRNPLGHNRVYVYCGDYFTPARWLASLKAGKVMITNGPLLRTRVSGQLPGHVFDIGQGVPREFRIDLKLSFHEKAPVEYLEIVKNGRVVFDVRLRELAENKGKLPPLRFTESGWFLLRAVTNNSETYQYASTAPYYVVAGGRPRISRESVQFFLDWLDEAEGQFADNPTVQSDISDARPFWDGLLQRANAD